MITFGPHDPALHARFIFKFYSLVKHGDGVISGICHNGWDPASIYLSEIGVSFHSSSHRGSIDQTPEERESRRPAGQNQGTILEPESRPRVDSYLPPPLLFRSSPLSHYMTKAPLQGLIDVQYCRDTKLPHRPCIGLLLYYDDGGIESLGQIRWDRKMSDRIFAPVCLLRGIEDGKHYVKDVRAITGPSSKRIEEAEDWLGIPTHGSLIWWFGHLGDHLTLL